MTLGQLIVNIIKDLKVNHVFGIPGDYNLRLLDYIADADGINWIGNCNELNAAYCADGYARENGISVLVTTHGVGELSAANGIAGSYAENVPVLHLVGYPKSKAIANDMPVHHTLANYHKNSFLQSFESITCSSIILTKYNYITELRLTIEKMLRTKKPCYIGIPSDLVDLEVSDDVDNIVFNPITTDPKIVKDIALKIKANFTNSKKPVFLIGTNVAKFNWKSETKALLDKTQTPYISTFMGKAIMDENNHMFAGIYAAKDSTFDAENIICESDCIISIGTLETDLNTGGFSITNVNFDGLIQIRPRHIKIGKEIFTNINVKSLLQQLGEILSKKNHANFDPINYKNKKLPRSAFTGLLDQNLFWKFASQFLIQSNNIVVAEAGTSLFGLLTEDMPKGVSFTSQLLWASIGYALPAAVGASFANPNRHIVVFVGDGAFQLSGQELSTIAKHKLNISIFLIQNDGYTIERAIHNPEQIYHDISKWDYITFSHSLGITNTKTIKTFSEFTAITDDLSSKEPKFIECIFARDDIPSLLKQIVKELR